MNYRKLIYSLPIIKSEELESEELESEELESEELESEEFNFQIPKFSIKLSHINEIQKNNYTSLENFLGLRK